MKTRLNITIDDTVLTYIKSYAAARQISISQIIEGHFRNIVTSEGQKENILEVMDRMETPSGIGSDDDFKKGYYEARNEKYGR
ncbi:DUF6364 family protein [Dyadobacter sp. SG02]|uniref:DUF6364 family protein n=1 Tax=Dyadobacter sp. SG02 TaxID=1855291 RepID=UPI00115F91F5|nr:DUF6364 family protein [Dyadobacter sp. SG02]